VLSLLVLLAGARAWGRGRIVLLASCRGSAGGCRWGDLRRRRDDHALVALAFLDLAELVIHLEFVTLVAALELLGLVTDRLRPDHRAQGTSAQKQNCHSERCYT
jgi:hypothetical protein